MIEDDEKVRCLVEQGFTPSLAHCVIQARSRELLPLTIWLVDNSSSMTISDGRSLVETSCQSDIQVQRCTRWEELRETVKYHAQLAALLDAPTKFILLNKPSGSHACVPQEMSIAERGTDWIDADLEAIQLNFSKLSPEGITPLTMHLQRISRSIEHFTEKVVLVVATDGRPTDTLGYSSVTADRAFESALREVQARAWVVIRLCTDDSGVLEYYQKLDDQMELSLEVLDDYLDEAKEVHGFNPWLTYSLSLHRCREMGMSCHNLHQWLDWLDERSMSRKDILHILSTLGLVDWPNSSYDLDEPTKWKGFCDAVEKEQKRLLANRDIGKNASLQAFKPWNPIRSRPTPWVNIRALRRQGESSFSFLWFKVPCILILVAIALHYAFAVHL